MTDKPRLIGHAFPLKQVSLVSAHEKNVWHGHILMLHCAVPKPCLVRVQGSFGNLLVKAMDNVLISAEQIMEARE